MRRLVSIASTAFLVFFAVLFAARFAESNMSGFLKGQASLGQCGDGLRQSWESCDDGNTRSGDGCSMQCLLEEGYSCYQTACAPVCGDARIRGGEECDDGNKKAGDGCSEFCRVEPGYSCMGAFCTVKCGDGVTLGSEQCDDGNARSGDGCSSCKVEAGWYCGGRPSQCYRSEVSASSGTSSTSPSSSASSRASSPVPSSAFSSLSSTGVLSSSIASSDGSSSPFLLPDWIFNMSSASSIRFFSRPSSTSSSSAPASSSSSSDIPSSSSEDASSSSSASSYVAACGNGILDTGEECDAGSLNGSPVTQCDASCMVLKPAASAESSDASSASSAASAPSSTRSGGILLMIAIALTIAIVGGIGAYFWLKYQQKHGDI